MFKRKVGLAYTFELKQLESSKIGHQVVGDLRMSLTRTVCIF